MGEVKRDIGSLEYVLRIGWISVRVILALWLASPGAHFLYQGF